MYEQANLKRRQNYRKTFINVGRRSANMTTQSAV